MTEIVELKDFIPAYTNAVQKLLEQLTNRPGKLTQTTLQAVSYSHLPGHQTKAIHLFRPPLQKKNYNTVFSL